MILKKFIFLVIATFLFVSCTKSEIRSQTDFKKNLDRKMFLLETNIKYYKEDNSFFDRETVSKLKNIVITGEDKNELEFTANLDSDYYSSNDIGIFKVQKNDLDNEIIKLEHLQKFIIKPKNSINSENIMNSSLDFEYKFLDEKGKEIYKMSTFKDEPIKKIEIFEREKVDEFRILVDIIVTLENSIILKGGSFLNYTPESTSENLIDGWYLEPVTFFDTNMYG